MSRGMAEAARGQMKTDYRAYVIGLHGRVALRVDLAADNECEAKEQARQLVDGNSVELWQGVQKLATFTPQASG